MRDFDRSSRNIFFIVKAIFAITIIVMICWFGFLGYVGYKVISDPNGIAHSAGQVVGDFKRGMETPTK